MAILTRNSLCTNKTKTKREKCIGRRRHGCVSVEKPVAMTNQQLDQFAFVFQRRKPALHLRLGRTQQVRCEHCRQVLGAHQICLPTTRYPVLHRRKTSTLQHCNRERVSDMQQGHPNSQAFEPAGGINQISVTHRQCDTSQTYGYLPSLLQNITTLLLVPNYTVQ